MHEIAVKTHVSLGALAAASCRDTGGFSCILVLPGRKLQITTTVVILPEITPGAAEEEQTQFPVEELIVQELHRVRLACEPC